MFRFKIKKAFLGIYMGSQSVSLVQCQRQRKKFAIAGYGVEKLNMSASGLDISLISNAIDKIRIRENLTATQAIIAVPEALVSKQYVYLASHFNDEEKFQLIALELAEKNKDFTDCFFDFCVFAQEGGVQKIMVVAATRSSLSAYFDIAKACQFNLVGIEIDNYVLSRFVHREMCHSLQIETYAVLIVQRHFFRLLICSEEQIIFSQEKRLPILPKTQENNSYAVIDYCLCQIVINFTRNALLLFQVSGNTPEISCCFLLSDVLDIFHDYKAIATALSLSIKTIDIRDYLSVNSRKDTHIIDDNVVLLTALGLMPGELQI